MSTTHQEPTTVVDLIKCRDCDAEISPTISTAPWCRRCFDRDDGNMFDSYIGKSGSPDYDWML